MSREWPEPARGPCLAESGRRLVAERRRGPRPRVRDEDLRALRAAAAALLDDPAGGLRSAAHVGAEPVYVSCEPELRALMGNAAYAELARHCAAHLSAQLPLLVHPATADARRRAATPTTPA